MLVGNGVYLRHVREADLEYLIPLLNDLTVRGEYLPGLITSPEKLRQEFAVTSFSNELFERFLIVDEDGRFLGTTWHFSSVPYFNAREIGYIMFDIHQRGKGIMTQAVSMLTNYLFENLQINRLEIRMDTRNQSSEKVAAKCGYIKEGVSRGAIYSKGEHFDMCVYAKLRDEWLLKK